MDILEKFTAKDKRNITKDWHELFPQLGAYKPMKLVNILGPLVVGITLIEGRGNTHYKPTFFVHNLCRPFPGLTITLISEVKFKSIKPSTHNLEYKEFAKNILEKALIPIEGDVCIDYVIKAYKEYFSNPNLGSITEYEDLALVCGWYGDNSKTEYALEIIKSALIRLPEERYFSNEGGFAEWFKNIKEWAYDKEKLRKICNEQIIELKLQNVPMRQII